MLRWLLPMLLVLVHVKTGAPSVVIESPWYGETGNRVRTVIKGMQLAKHLGTELRFPELWLLKTKSFKFGPPGAAELTIKARAAYKLPESPKDPRGFGAYRDLDGADINMRLRQSLVDTLQNVEPLPATHLVVHVRGGRGLFFTARGIPIEPKYAQPPFSFYKKVIEAGMVSGDGKDAVPWTDVTVVSMDRSNPVVDLIASSTWPTVANAPTIRTGSSLTDDYRFLLSARSIAYGHGSFMPFLLQISSHAERTYFSAPMSLGGGYIDCRYNSEVQQHYFPMDDYWTKVLPWRNNAQQIAHMKAYGLSSDQGGGDVVPNLVAEDSEAFKDCCPGRQPKPIRDPGTGMQSFKCGKTFADECAAASSLQHRREAPKDFCGLNGTGVEALNMVRQQGGAVTGFIGAPDMAPPTQQQHQHQHDPPKNGRVKLGSNAVDRMVVQLDKQNRKEHEHPSGKITSFGRAPGGKLWNDGRGGADGVLSFQASPAGANTAVAETPPVTAEIPQPIVKAETTVETAREISLATVKNAVEAATAMEAKAVVEVAPATEAKAADVAPAIQVNDMPPGWAPTTCALEGSDRELAAVATNTTQGCGLVVYTTIFYSQDPQRLPDPRSRLMFPGVEKARFQPDDGFFRNTGLDGVPGNTCFVLVAGRASAKALREHSEISPWVLLEVPEQPAGGNKKRHVQSGRQASRQFKLLPHLFFRAEATRYTIFMDWKLELKKDPRTLLHAVTVARAPHPAGFAALRHPCTTSYYQEGTPVYVRRMCQNFQKNPQQSWYREEAHHVIHNRATSDIKALEKQVARYHNEVSSDGSLGDLHQFAEGALLFRDRDHPVSGSLNCAWWQEYTRDDSSDRDQLSLAYVLASRASPLSSAYPGYPPGSGEADLRLFSKSTERGGVFIISEGPVRSRCKDLCHWYHDSPKTRAIATGILLQKQGNKRLPAKYCQDRWWCRDHGSSLMSPLR